VASLVVEHARDVTAAVRGASEWQAEAFRNAAFRHRLHRWGTEREARVAVWNGATGGSAQRRRPTSSSTRPADKRGTGTGGPPRAQGQACVTTGPPIPAYGDP
jgi:hypothetical protein